MLSERAKIYLNRCFKPRNCQNKLKAYSRDMVEKAVSLAEDELLERAAKVYSLTCEMNNLDKCLEGGPCTTKCILVVNFINQLRGKGY